MLPKDYVGPIMELCQQRRGEYISMEYLDAYPCDADIPHAV